MSLFNQAVVGVPRWAQPELEEPAHGLFLRIAEINGQPPSDMARSMGFSLASLRRGYNIDKMAKLIRCDEVQLAANSFSFAVGEKVSIRGQTIGLRRDLLRKKRRVCRCCLAEAPYHRFWWDLSFIDFCPRHWTRLEDRCSCESAHLLSWYDGSVGMCRHCTEQGITARKVEAIPDGETAIERHLMEANAYLLGRLGVCPKQSVPILDALPLDEVVDVIERVGAFELGGYSKKWKTAAKLHQPLAEIRAWGFNMLAKGFWPSYRDPNFEAYIRANPRLLGPTLDKWPSDRDPDFDQYLVENPKDSNPTLNKRLGWFYHWFNGKGGKSFSPGLAALLEKMPWNYFSSLGQGLAKSNLGFSSHYMTLNQAAKECAQGKTTLRRLLRQFGKDRDLVRKGLAFRLEGEFVCKLKSVLEEECNFDQVREILGAGHSTVHRFIKSGFFSPVVKGGGDRHEYAFRRDHIEAFLELLGKDAPVLTACPEEALPLQRAARTYGAPLERLCTSIILGHTELAGRIEDGNGLGQFVITRAAVKSFKRQFREEGEDYLLEGMFQFRHMRQLELGLERETGRSVA